MVRCVRYLEIIQEDGLVAARVGATVRERLGALVTEFENVSNVLGKGLLVAFDLPDGEVRSPARAGMLGPRPRGSLVWTTLDSVPATPGVSRGPNHPGLGDAPGGSGRLGLRATILHFGRKLRTSHGHV